MTARCSTSKRVYESTRPPKPSTTATAACSTLCFASWRRAKSHLQRHDRRVDARIGRDAANRGIEGLGELLFHAIVDACEGQTDAVHPKVVVDLGEDRHAGEVDLGHSGTVDHEVTRCREFLEHVVHLASKDAGVRKEQIV